jgi:hypothetical protein
VDMQVLNMTEYRYGMEDEHRIKLTRGCLRKLLFDSDTPIEEPEI